MTELPVNSIRHTGLEHQFLFHLTGFFASRNRISPFDLAAAEDVHGLLGFSALLPLAAVKKRMLREAFTGQRFRRRRLCLQKGCNPDEGCDKTHGLDCIEPSLTCHAMWAPCAS